MTFPNRSTGRLEAREEPSYGATPPNFTLTFTKLTISAHGYGHQSYGIHSSHAPVTYTQYRSTAHERLRTTYKSICFFIEMTSHQSHHNYGYFDDPWQNEKHTAHQRQAPRGRKHYKAQRFWKSTHYLTYSGFE